MFFSPIPDHLSHRNTLNHVGVWKKKIGHGRSVVILQPCVDVLSLINKPVNIMRKMKRKQKSINATQKPTNNQKNHKTSKTIKKKNKKKPITSERKHDEEGTHPSEAITGSLMISCEIGQMNSGGQSDGTHGTTLSLDGDLEESPSTGTSENQNINKQQ